MGQRYPYVPHIILLVLMALTLGFRLGIHHYLYHNPPNDINRDGVTDCVDFGLAEHISRTNAWYRHPSLDIDCINTGYEYYETEAEVMTTTTDRVRYSGVVVKDNTYIALENFNTDELITLHLFDGNVIFAVDGVIQDINLEYVEVIHKEDTYTVQYDPEVVAIANDGFVYNLDGAGPSLNWHIGVFTITDGVHSVLVNDEWFNIKAPLDSYTLNINDWYLEPAE